MKVEVESGLSSRGYPRDVLVLERRNVPEFLYGL